MGATAEVGRMGVGVGWEEMGKEEEASRTSRSLTLSVKSLSIFFCCFSSIFSSSFSAEEEGGEGREIEEREEEEGGK